LSQFGWDEKVRFVPYWRKNSGISVNSTVKGVVASGWTRGQKQLMVLVVNDKDKSANASLLIDPKRFGFESSTLSVSLYRTGGLNGKPKDPTRVRKHDFKTPLSLMIPAHSFQLIRLQPS
jgi:hypothetical protein